MQIKWVILEDTEYYCECTALSLSVRRGSSEVDNLTRDLTNDATKDLSTYSIYRWCTRSVWYVCAYVYIYYTVDLSLVYL